MKRLNEWFAIKSEINTKAAVPAWVSVGQVWWATLDENVGFEINGKKPNYTRPVVVLSVTGRFLMLVVPLTSKEHIGSWFVPVQLKKHRSFACLHQIRVIDRRRLESRMGTLHPNELMRIKAAFCKHYC